MGAIRFGLPEELVIALKKQAGIDEFVETGAFKGDTARWAANHFRNVTTIELPGEWYNEAETKLEAYPRVLIFSGDSRLLLKMLMPGFDHAIFWLDAHWMGSGPKSEKGECGLLDEIAAINTSPLDHIILCDDARYFENPPPPPHNPKEWPTMWQVTEALDNGARRYVIVEEDVIVAVPMAMREWLAGYLSK